MEIYIKKNIYKKISKYMEKIECMEIYRNY